MTEMNRYALMLEALAELKPEIDSARRSQSQSVPALPRLSEVLAEFHPMPSEAMFMGVASDGFPVLLNLHDPLLDRSSSAAMQDQAKHNCFKLSLPLPRKCIDRKMYNSAC